MKSKNNIATAFVACITLLPPALLHASEQDIRDEEMMFMNIEKVFAATKVESKIQKVPNKVVIITEKDIKRRNYKYLVDVLEDLPGFNVYRHVQSEFFAEVIVRGIFQNNKLVVIWNGQKINEPSNKPFHFGNWISMDNVKKVEIIYGPSSALYGADAVNGVINIVTKDYDDMKDKREIALSYGINQTYHTYANVGVKLGELKGTLFGSYRKSDGVNFLKDYHGFYSGLESPAYYAQGGQPGFYAPEESYDIQARAQIGPKTHIHYLRVDDANQSAWGFGVPVFEFSRENVWRNIQDNISLQHETQLLEHLILRSSLGANYYRISPETQFIQSHFLQFKSFTRQDYKFERGIKYSLNEEAVYDNKQLQVIAGYEVENIYEMPKLSTVSGDKARPNLPFSYQTNRSIPYAEVQYLKQGAYAQAQYAITDQWGVTAGGRWDRVWDYEDSWNPRVGLTYTPMDTLSARLHYAQATLAPSPYFRYEGFGDAIFPGPNSSGAVPNNNLKPEKYQTVEAGVSVTPTRNVSVDVSGFYNQIKDYVLHQRAAKLPYTYIDRVGNIPAYVSTAATGLAIEINDNGGQLTSYGGDIAGKMKFGDRATAWLYYSYITGQQEELSPLSVSSPGKFDLALVSPHTLKGGAEVQIINRLFLTPYFTWIGHIKTRPDTAWKGQDMDGFFVMNLSGSYEISRYRFWMLAKNIFNTEYYTPGGTGGHYDPASQPQDKFSWQFGVSVFF